MKNHIKNLKEPREDSGVDMEYMQHSIGGQQANIFMDDNQI